MNTALVPQPTVSPRLPHRSALRRCVGVVARPDSYRKIGYLLLGLPLGTAWFAALVTCLAVGFSLLVVALLGIPVLLATWYVSRAGANVERGAARALLGVRLPSAPMASSADGNLWVRLRSMSAERRRWRELAYLLLRFPAGILTFTAAVTALTAPFIVAAVPISARIGDRQPDYGNWAYSDTLHDLSVSSWSWLLIPLGAALLVAAFHVLVGLAGACGRWATAWLDDAVSPDPAEFANLHTSDG
jgi:hypothetical protein